MQRWRGPESLLGSMKKLRLVGSNLGLLAMAGLLLPFQVGVGKPIPEDGTLANITTERLLKADAVPDDWLTGGRDYRQSYYSPLTDINPANVHQLGFAWSYDLKVAGALEATPTVVDGVMFTSGPMGAVYALDAKSGAVRWTFAPQVDLSVMRTLCCGPSNRGVAVWHGKVYVASLDGHLYALNASSGAIVWRADTIADRSRSYSITGAPYIAGNRVVIGNSGAEFNARGYITAYDIETGKQAWRFFTVPADPKKGFEHPELEWAAKTWDPNSRWELGLGGTVWDGMAYDPKLNLLYVGTGNGTPWTRAFRSPAGGDNLFLTCILAINPDTGRLVWYYQTVPAANWDFTATQKMVLADLKINGRIRQVILQAPKNGFFYVLDRRNGKLLSAERYATVNWASHIDMKTGRPVETKQGDYSKTPKLIFPGSWGGHNWPPMAHNPKNGLVYIPVMHVPVVLAMPQQAFEYREGQLNMGASEFMVTASGSFFSDNASTSQVPPIHTLAAGQPDYKPRTFLSAWDPVVQRQVWQVETITGHDFVDVSGSGGVMTTASGLVFQGRSTGQLVVLDAKTGAQLHSIEVGNSMVAAPMTYRIDRQQYVVIMAGGGDTESRILAFKLGGTSVPQRQALESTIPEPRVPPIASFGTPEQIALGAKLFERTCAVCHAKGSRAPDLSKMNEQVHQEFRDIVLKGLRAEKGMGDFSAMLSEEDVYAIHAYATSLAWKRYGESQEP
jgi:quinohemoprotein ethanol dehydrogenase